MYILWRQLSLKQTGPPQGQIVVSGGAVLVVDGFMDACDKCIGSELDLTDVTEDNMVNFGEVTIIRIR